MHTCYIISLIVTFAVTAQAWPDPPCRKPPLAVNYTVEQYAGRWFEIGKIQTSGGAFFERGCECTHIDVTPTPNNPSSVNISNICNRNSPQGPLVVFNETLTSNMNPPNGHYNASFAPGVPMASYNVILLKSDQYSVEYDCTHEFGVTNYCVHILSRTTTLDSSIVNMVLKLAEQYDLNTAKLDYVQTKHANCSYFR